MAETGFPTEAFRADPDRPALSDPRFEPTYGLGGVVATS